uniref:threonine synthase-like 1 isoform X2 n=1 Tax=Panthera onca TaxID=9690 RepID=UPI00295441C3|nr:threonine synthase-like 1 isoform X2 [Panthera onca]XP_060515124.1 threonine synthase-like 1 isoform X2 [Panthera onca]
MQLILPFCRFDICEFRSLEFIYNPKTPFFLLRLTLPQHQQTLHLRLVPVCHIFTSQWKLQVSTYKLKSQIRKCNASLDSSNLTYILKASNLERHLHMMANKDGGLMTKLFNQLEEQQHFQIDEMLVEKLQQDFVADWCSERECLAAIHSTYSTSGYILDPHTAVAKVVADRMRDKTCPVIVASTAHYSKFAPAILQALKIKEINHTSSSQLYLLSSYNALPPPHEALLERMKQQEKMEYQVCAADVDVLKNHVEKLIQNQFI